MIQFKHDEMTGHIVLLDGNVIGFLDIEDCDGYFIFNEDNPSSLSVSQLNEIAGKITELKRGRSIMNESENLMSNEAIRLGFEKWAEDKPFDLSCDFFYDEGANPYTEQGTALAYEIWCSAIADFNTHPTDDRLKRIRAEIEVIRESYRSDCIKAGNEGFNNRHMSSGGSASACTRILEIIDKEGAE